MAVCPSPHFFFVPCTVPCITVTLKLTWRWPRRTRTQRKLLGRAERNLQTHLIAKTRESDCSQSTLPSGHGGNYLWGTGKMSNTLFCAGTCSTEILWQKTPPYFFSSVKQTHRAQYKLFLMSWGHWHEHYSLLHVLQWLLYARGHFNTK